VAPRRAEADGQAAAQAGQPPSDGSQPVGAPTTCQECGAEVDAGPACRYCGTAVGETPSGDALRLVLPDGHSVVVGIEPLKLGRDEEFSSVAPHLMPFGNVSRHHALIARDRDTVVVTDLESTNGTFLNDVRLDPGRSTPAAIGDRIRLAAHCVLQLTSGVAAGRADDGGTVR